MCFADRLPDRQTSADVIIRPREYISTLVVKSKENGGNLSGQTISRAGLRSLPGLYIAAIERDGAQIPAPVSFDIMVETIDLIKPFKEL